MSIGSHQSLAFDARISKACRGLPRFAPVKNLKKASRSVNALNSYRNESGSCISAASPRLNRHVSMPFQDGPLSEKVWPLNRNPAQIGPLALLHPTRSFWKLRQILPHSIFAQSLFWLCSEDTLESFSKSACRRPMIAVAPLTQVL